VGRWTPSTDRRGVRFLVGLPRRLLGSILPGSTDDEAGIDRSRASTLLRAPTAGPAIRALWRNFARRVVPDRWPQRTPGEVSRRAIDAGFPRESVVELTSVFRDVEYGGEPLSDDQYRRAQRASDALDAGEPESDAADGDGSTDGDGSADDTDDGEVRGS